MKPPSARRAMNMTTATPVSRRFFLTFPEGAGETWVADWSGYVGAAGVSGLAGAGGGSGLPERPAGPVLKQRRQGPMAQPANLPRKTMKPGREPQVPGRMPVRLQPEVQDGMPVRLQPQARAQSRQLPPVRSPAEASKAEPDHRPFS